MTHFFDQDLGSDKEQNEQDYEAVILEIKENEDPQKFFEENDLPLKRNFLSLIEEEKQDANEADESMETRPERRRMESLQSIPENEQQTLLNSKDTPVPQVSSEPIIEVTEEVVRDSEITGFQFASKNQVPNLAQRTNSHQPIVRPLKPAEKEKSEVKNIRNTEAPRNTKPLEIL